MNEIQIKGDEADRKGIEMSRARIGKARDGWPYKEMERREGRNCL